MPNGHAEDCRVVLVGAGAMAREHCRAFQHLPGVAVAGVWNRTRQRAESLAGEFGIPHVADSIEELYRVTKADLAVMAVLEPAINAVAKECLKAPWSLLMEKPPGIDFQDALEIQREARARSRRVFVALNRRFLSSTRGVAAQLQDQAGPRFIIVNDQQDMEVARSLGHPAELVDSWMFANSIHLIDYLRFFGRGPVQQVRPIYRWVSDKPGLVVAAVDFESGDKGLYTCTWDGPGPWSVSVSTAGARWEMKPLEQATVQLRGERRQAAIETGKEEIDFKPGFRSQAVAAIAAARGAATTLPTLDDAIETMGLIARIYERE